MRQLSLAFAALLLAASFGCGDRDNREVGGVTDTMPPAEVTTPIDVEDPAAPRDYAFEERSDFVQSVRQQLAGIDAEVDQLASQAKSRGGAVSDRALANIRSARQTVQRHLARAETATASNWNQIQSATTEAVEHLEEAIEMAQPK